MMNTNKTTLESLQAEINELKLALNETLKLLNSTNNKMLVIEEIPKPTITKFIAEEGFIYKRNHDGFIMGKELSLGYDYSLGFRRKDDIKWFTQIPDPDYVLEELELEELE